MIQLLLFPNGNINVEIPITILHISFCLRLRNVLSFGFESSNSVLSPYVPSSLQ